MSTTSERRTLLTVAEVASHYRVSKAAVYDWIRRGKIIITRNPGGSIRIPVTSVPDYQV